MGLKYDYFRKSFKNEFGLPPTQYQLSVIMASVCKILINENLTIKEIAKQFNFCDEFHFSKQFKKIVGVSPKEYKQFCNKT